MNQFRTPYPKASAVFSTLVALVTNSASADLITGISIKEDDGTLPNVQMTSTDAVDGQGLPGNTPAFTGTHSTTWHQHWFSSQVAGAFITIDLGANFSLDAIQIWNENENNAGRFRGLKDARIYVSPDEDTANLVALSTGGTGTHDNGSGDFLFPIGEGLSTYTGFSLDLSGISNIELLQDVRLIKIETITNHGSNGGSGLAEVQFSGSAPIPSGSDIMLVIQPSQGNPGNYDFSWPSLEGKVYDLVSSTDLDTNPETWPIWQAHANLPATLPTNSLLNVAGGGGIRRFFAVVEKDPPPLLSADFEGDNGGFTFSSLNGTNWAWGDPDSSGVGGSITEGNGGSSNCWGTGIGNPGYYADPTTDSCLRSPTFSLVGVTNASLTFAEALDLEGSESAVVKLINAVGDVEIATLYTATDSDPNIAQWAAANGGIPINLSTGIGETVYLQWCLSGNGGEFDDYLGWYIDDVVVTAE